MIYDPHTYAITVQLVNEDGEAFFEATIKEFPDIACYGETHSEAYDLAIDAIETSFTLLEECGTEIPAPIRKVGNLSGRVTLRMPRSIHAITIRDAETEGVSLNSYINSILSEKAGSSNVLYVLGNKLDYILREFTTTISRPNDVYIMNALDPIPPVYSAGSTLLLGSNQL